MLGITEKDWSFEKVHERDPCRAARLESCGPPDELINALVQSIVAIKKDDLRIGIDSKCNRFIEYRVIVQFRIAPELYDWFYNGRTGYRAQFWISIEAGMKFNERILRAVVKALMERLAAAIPVRRICVRDDGASCDIGEMTASREGHFRSLRSKTSKIWIGEQLIRTSTGPMMDILCLPLARAAKLCVPRWPVEGEGLRAPFPCPEYSWLDVKGGFLNSKGESDQIKPQNDRAQKIHDYGWT